MRSLLASAWLVLLLPSVCSAWGGEGYQLIALIAVVQMTPASRAAAKELLGDANMSDAEVVTWADEVRRARSHTAPWYYGNISHDAAAFDATRDGRNGQNIIDALERQARVLTDETAPREQRVEALKFVVHLVGDLHQPLHCADRNGDKGGNTRLVFFIDRRNADSLHYVWDTAPVRKIVGQRAIAPVAEAMSKSVTPARRRDWASDTPASWANEAHRVAVEKVYAAVTEGGDPPKLGRDDVTGATPVVADQIKRAGVRLAMVLNQCLASADSPTSRPTAAAAAATRRRPQSRHIGFGFRPTTSRCRSGRAGVGSTCTPRSSRLSSAARRFTIT